MILDKLENLAQYNTIPKLSLILDFIKNSDLNNLAVGKHTIDSERVYANVEEYYPKALDDCKYESHEIYADLQLVLEGVENFRLAFVEDIKEEIESVVIRDVKFFNLKHNYFSEIILRKGEFAFFPPNYLHMPGIGNPNCFTKKVKKIVFKIAYD